MAIRVRRKLSPVDVIDFLTDLCILRGIAAYIHSHNGPEFVAGAVRQWMAAVGARTAFIEPGSHWENGSIESFNARLRDELLDREVFYTLKATQVLIESWWRHYNAIRPHGSLGYRPPAPETIVMPSWPPGSAALRRSPSLAERRAPESPTFYGPMVRQPGKRTGWAGAKWTTIEADAIRGRLWNKGPDFLTLVKLDTAPPPEWFPMNARVGR